MLDDYLRQRGLQNTEHTGDRERSKNIFIKCNEGYS